MKKLFLFLSALLLQAAAISVFAQNKPQAGDMISGVVFEDAGPMIMVNVTERDSADNIVAHTITDMEGKFSFKLVNPKDRLKISYVGYTSIDIPIDKQFFEIRMEIPMIETTVYPRDRKIIASESSYMKRLQEYAPQGYTCGYIMKNAWDKVLWGIFIVKEEGNYSLKYKEGDKIETRSINADLAKELEDTVNTKIADIEYAVNNPVTVALPGGLPLVDIIYDGDVAIAITPDKAVSFWTWYPWPEKMHEGAWKQEYLKFIQNNK